MARLAVDILAKSKIRITTRNISISKIHIMASNATNKAAWQMEAKGPFTVKEAEIFEPGKGEIRIKVL